MPGLLGEILILLGVGVFVVAAFQRLHLPSSLGYLLVGVLVGPHVLGWIPDDADRRVLAEFGVVFLLFTIGLNFSLARLIEMRRSMFGLGAAQVLITTVAFAAGALAAGLPLAAAFVVGAVIAQSSTSIMSKQLADQGEVQSRTGRLAIGMSVFQDVTAVPFVVILTALSGASGDSVVLPLAVALAKAVVAFVVVLALGRWLLRPAFRWVAVARSAEVFTLAVLLIALGAAWLTAQLGMSLALGGFLAGVVLAETEFRHQVDATIRPFRDVLLGLFFVTIGMLLDIEQIPQIGHWALALTAAMLVVKALIVVAITRMAGIEPATAWRAAIILAIGGEFGFALLSLALGAGALDPALGQLLLMSVLFSMMLAPLLIRYSAPLVAWLPIREVPRELPPGADIISGDGAELRDHVIVCGFGRVGQTVARFLDEEAIPYVALDLDVVRVREARAGGDRVYFGESASREVLEAAGLDSARMLVVSYDDQASALRLLDIVRPLRPELPVLVRTRDESGLDQLQRAGATEVISETLEAGMMLVSHVLLLLGVPGTRIMQRLRGLRADRYRLLHGFFHGQDALFDPGEESFRERLHAVTLPEGAYAVNRPLGELALDQLRVIVTHMTRGGIRGLAPDARTQFQPNDVVVLYGAPEDLERAERRLLNG